MNFRRLSILNLQQTLMYLPNSKKTGSTLNIPNTLMQTKPRRKQFDQLFFWNLNGINGTNLSLKYSLWDRDPTNDLRVAKFCMSLPDHQFVQQGYDRSLVRRATKGYLPEEIRLNQKTRGVQGADAIPRMQDQWKDMIEELESVNHSSFTI